MKCKICNFENTKNDVYCQNCGYYLKMPLFVKLTIISIIVSIISQFVPKKFVFILLCIAPILLAIAIIQAVINQIQIRQIRKKNNIDMPKLLKSYTRKVDMTDGFIVMYLKSEGINIALSTAVAIISSDENNIKIVQNDTSILISHDSITQIDIYKQKKDIFFKILTNDNAKYYFKAIGNDYNALTYLEEKYNLKICDNTD